MLLPMIRISILRLKRIRLGYQRLFSKPTNDKNLNSEIETMNEAADKDMNVSTNDKNLNSEIETCMVKSQRIIYQRPTNDKNLNSEIETALMCVIFGQEIRSVATNDKNLNSEIETITLSCVRTRFTGYQ